MGLVLSGIATIIFLIASGLQEVRYGSSPLYQAILGALCISIVLWGIRALSESHSSNEQSVPVSNRRRILGLLGAAFLSLLLTRIYLGREEFLRDPKNPKWQFDDRPTGQGRPGDVY